MSLGSECPWCDYRTPLLAAKLARSVDLILHATQEHRKTSAELIIAMQKDRIVKITVGPAHPALPVDSLTVEVVDG